MPVSRTAQVLMVLRIATVTPYEFQRAFNERARDPRVAFIVLVVAASDGMRLLPECGL
jgi:hypothetical protein